MKIFVIHATKSHQAMTRIQKMGMKLSKGCNMINVRDSITSIVWMTDAIHVNSVMIENIFTVRNQDPCPENSVSIQYIVEIFVFLFFFKKKKQTFMTPFYG